MIWLRAITALAIQGCNKPEVPMVIWPAPRMARFAALGWLLMLSVAAHGQASGGAAGQTGTAGEAAAAKTDSKASKRRAAPKVLPGGSSETPAERSARLKRECKGRPDAGACSGHTQ